NAWLGTHVVVTDGSTIGRDAIIGAGAVVVGAIPEFAIATGIPAKVVRDRREPFDSAQGKPGAGSRESTT
ncbi:MAG: acyltransferase, partial [Vicinamibacterales bacterium]